MNTFKNIVVATDFSESAQVAYQYARHIATVFGSTLHVVSAYQPIIDTAYPEHIGYAVPIEDLEKLATERLDEFVKKTEKEDEGDTLAVTTKVKVTKEVLMGSAADVLIEKSKDPSVDLLILGSIGEHAWYDRVFGSVSVHVAREAFCPVLLVPQNAHFYGIQSILYAASLASAAPAVVGMAIDWAKPLGATMHFVHVNIFDTDKSDGLFKIILAQKAPMLRYSIENTFAGSVREGIYDFCLERGVDMVIAYTHHYGFIEDLMRVSVSKDLAWHTRLPILFIHNDIRKEALA